MLNSKHRQPVPGPLCATFAPLLPVLDDLTDARLADDTRAHLAECAWCRAQRATYDHFDEALRLHFAPDALPFLPLHLLESSMSDSQDVLQGALADDAAGDADPLRITVAPLPMSPRPPRRSWRLATGAASLAAVLVISLLAGVIFMSHGRPQSATGRHATATPAIVPGSQISLTAVGMASATDGWAIGRKMAANANGGSSQDPAYALHFTGGRWVEVKTEIHAWISVIKMLSPTDGWAIGTAVYHYDGVAWRAVKLPAMAQFNAIDVVSPNDIWIAGDGTWTESPDGNATILHYDGSVWARQVTPHLLDFFSIASLSMVSANEGWAVGAATGTPDSQGNAPPTGVILHYNGGAWNLAKTLPNLDLHTISMGSAADGWIGGDRESFAPAYPSIGGKPPQQVNFNEPVLLRFTSGQWIETAPPAIPGVPPSGQITKITMVSATSGWMFAALDHQSLNQDNGALLSGIFRLVQGHWAPVTMPEIAGRRFATFWQATFLSSDEFWGVGDTTWATGIPDNTGGYQPTVTPLIVHYKSGAWSVIES